MIRRAALVLLCLLSLTGSAGADPISIAAYRQGLAQARTQLADARAASGAAREQRIARALATLDGLRDVLVGDVIYTALPHAPVQVIARAADDASLDRAVATLDETIAWIDRAAAPGARPVDPRARERLEAVLSAGDFQRHPDWRDALTELVRDLLANLFPGLRLPPITATQVALLIGPPAIGLLAYVLWTSARGARERLARETILAAVGAAPRVSAAGHLAAAEAAARSGRWRDAVRELFRFALRALDERGTLRYDPALTDREVLARAAGLPSVRELAALVAVYERAWYGLREPDAAEFGRARELARRVAA